MMQSKSEKAKVAELVDALDLGSSGATCESSSLSFRTIYRKKELFMSSFFYVKVMSFS